MNALRQSMSWMHTWTGLLFGWVLYFMFVTGTPSYYDTEIDRWMQPEQPPPVEVADPGLLFQTALDHAQAQAPNADSYFIRLPTTRSYSPYLFVNWNGTNAEGGRLRGSAELLADGTVVQEGRDTGGGQALYRMHWAFHYIPSRLGEIISGFAAFFMLAAIISGIITHKKIFADFFTLRFGKGQRSWLDSHNMISVMSLPYQIMITFSGLIFVASTFFIPIFLAQYGVSDDVVQVVSEEVFGFEEPVARTGKPAELTALKPLIAQTQTLLGEEPVTRISITNPGDETAAISLHGTLAGGILRDAPGASFHGVSGELREFTPRAFEGAMTIIDSLEGLHEGLFAGPVLRILFFISGLMGCAMIATGLVLWTKKRRQKLGADFRPERNLIIIERLNVGVIAGLPIAVAAYFWANRLLPLEMTARAEWEMHILFLTWLAALIHSLVRKPQRAWTEQLIAAAAAYVTIPVLNAFTSAIHLGNTLPLPGRAGDFALAGVDLWLLIIGLGFGYAAYVSIKKQAALRVRTPRQGKAIEAPAPQAAE